MEHFKAFWKRRTLLWELVKRGIKLKYRKSYLGLVWSLLEPLLGTAVLTVVFGTLLGRGGKDFPLYALCGRLFYGFFSSSTKSAAKSIRVNASMIKKVYVPKYLYPLSSILFNYIITGISLFVLIPLCAYCGQAPSLHMLYAFIPFALLFLLTYGCGMILATVTVFFRDMEYLWDVVLMVVMYTSAIMYMPGKIMESGYAWILKYNPLFGVITNFRDAIMGKPMEWNYLLMAAAYGIALSFIGTFLFYKKQDDFILAL